MTTIAVMQPYFVPYAGYFRLFAVADVVVMFDCVQFPRRDLFFPQQDHGSTASSSHHLPQASRSLLGRNKILRQAGGLTPVSFPVGRQRRWVTNEQIRDVHTGEQIHFPHLGKNERDMVHRQLRLGKSFETCSFLP